MCEDLQAQLLSPGKTAGGFLDRALVFGEFEIHPVAATRELILQMRLTHAGKWMTQILQVFRQMLRFESVT